MEQLLYLKTASSYSPNSVCHSYNKPTDQARYPWKQQTRPDIHGNFAKRFLLTNWSWNETFREGCL